MYQHAAVMLIKDTIIFEQAPLSVNDILNIYFIKPKPITNIDRSKLKQKEHKTNTGKTENIRIVS